MSTILLVDDDDGVRRVIGEFLADAGFEVISAADTIIGRRQLELHPEVDLCLVDIVMPPGTPDGTDFAQVVRNQIPSLPVILMTGYYSAVGAIGDAASSLIYKPVDLDKLEAEIRRFVTN